MAQIKPNSSRPTAVTVLLFTFAVRDQVAVASVQSMLRLPGDVFHLLADRRLARLRSVRADGRSMPIGPRGFNHDRAAGEHCRSW